LFHLVLILSSRLANILAERPTEASFKSTIDISVFNACYCEILPLSMLESLPFERAWFEFCAPPSSASC